MCAQPETNTKATGWTTSVLTLTILGFSEVLQSELQGQTPAWPEKICHMQEEKKKSDENKQKQECR